MNRDEPACAYHLALEAELRGLTNGLEELKGRVRGIEATVGRGVMLLVANLVGVAMTLLQQVLRTL